MNLEKTGSQLGSNEGARYRDTESGNEHYVKHYKNADQAKTEVLTAKIYKHMGIPTTDPEYTTINDKPTVVSKWNPELKVEHPRAFDRIRPEQADTIGRMYHAAVLTKNWDIIGLEHDNIMTDKSGKVHSIDQGGAMHFRARGASKPFDHEIGEHSSLRNNQEASGHVFSSAFAQHPSAETSSLQSVRNIDDNHVKGLFQNSGLSNWEDLHKAFQSRKAKLLAKYDMKENVRKNIHPKLDSSGNEVHIRYPSTSSPTHHWEHPDAVAAVTPNDHSAVPEGLNNIPFKTAEAPEDWSKVDGKGTFSEPTMMNPNGKKVASGVIMKEGEKVWVVHPTNEFGGYSATFPKGKVDYGIDIRSNAIKETHEESGLKAELTGHAVDVPRTTSYTRYYTGKRTGGHPADMGWESQKVSLVPIKDLHEVVTHPADQPIVNLLQNGKI